MAEGDHPKRLLSYLLKNGEWPNRENGNAPKPCPFKCPECGLDVTTEEVLAEHRSSVHHVFEVEDEVKL